MSRFAPNLETKGRVIRALFAAAMFIGAFFVYPHSKVGAALLVISGAFVAFEAFRGWCVMRACGIKTKY